MLKVLEHYVSMQGEGRRTGTMTQFVRFAGCNLRCPGWPCDTPQAIFPDQWRGQYEEHDVNSLVAAIRRQAELTGAKNVCFTGGEPLIQPNDELIRVMAQLWGTAARWSIEIFTNGTKEIPSPILNMALINMDWKLGGSGEGQKNHDIRLINTHRLKSGDMIKFVVKDEADLDEARNLYQAIRTRADFWCGSAFGEITEAQIVEYIMKHQLPWKLNVQVHKYVWNPEERYV